MVDTTTNSSGIGQQTPFDANTDLTSAFFLCQQLIALMDTMKPVQVMAVYPGQGSPPAAGTVDVMLLVSQLDGAGNATPSGIVNKLPYFRFQGGPWAIILDPAVNDIGFVFCPDRDISNLMPAIAGGNSPQVTAGSFRKYSVSDGIYVGGCFNAVPAGTLWLKPDGTLQVTDAKGNVITTSEAGFAVITAPGGDFTVNGISVTLHTHPVTTAPGETGAPVG